MPSNFKIFSNLKFFLGQDYSATVAFWTLTSKEIIKNSLIFLAQDLQASFKAFSFLFDWLQWFLLSNISYELYDMDHTIGYCQNHFWASGVLSFVSRKAFYKSLHFHIYRISILDSVLVYSFIVCKQSNFQIDGSISLMFEQ